MRTSAAQLKVMKERGERIPVLTAYDYAMAAALDKVGIPVLLVGDSLGNVFQGNETTLPVTLNDIIYHSKAVVRATKNAMVIADLPFMTYQVSVEDALRSAGRCLQEANVQAVKLEGGIHMASTVQALVERGIPVMGHLGMTPQSVNAFGGFKVQGKTESAARKILADAIALQDAGAFGIVLELVPSNIAAIISEKLEIPTIGIGSGPKCDGEVQVLHDILGLLTDFVPKHTKQYANLADIISKAASQYASEVKSSSFPTKAQSSVADKSVEEKVREIAGR